MTAGVSSDNPNILISYFINLSAKGMFYFLFILTFFGDLVDLICQIAIFFVVPLSPVSC